MDFNVWRFEIIYFPKIIFGSLGTKCFPTIAIFFVLFDIFDRPKYICMRLKSFTVATKSKETNEMASYCSSPMFDLALYNTVYTSTKWYTIGSTKMVYSTMKHYAVTLMHNLTVDFKWSLSSLSCLWSLLHSHNLWFNVDKQCCLRNTTYFIIIKTALLFHFLFL